MKIESLSLARPIRDSAIVDGNGRIVAALDTGVEDVLTETVPLDDRVSLYSRWGDAIGLTSLAITIGLIPLAYSGLPVWRALDFPSLRSEDEELDDERAFLSTADEARASRFVGRLTRGLVEDNQAASARRLVAEPRAQHRTDRASAPVQAGPQPEGSPWPRYDSRTTPTPCPKNSACSRPHSTRGVSTWSPRWPARSRRQPNTSGRATRTGSRPTLGADDFSPVSHLSTAWAAWAKGWSFCKTLAVHEIVGLERTHEPVDVTVGFRLDQLTDPYRRYASPASIATEEMTCVRFLARSTVRPAKLTSGAATSSSSPTCLRHGRASYLILYGNPHAELPEYTTDLRTTGEGYGLEIASRYYKAMLSHQMGQLERLISTREHGVELYAGGHRHGDPPMVDGAVTTSMSATFQNPHANWPRCPNYETVRGPLCVRVRRWGFPYSPIHPVLTPARVHFDQTYTFFAGLPYFSRKEHRGSQRRLYSHDARRRVGVLGLLVYRPPVDRSAGETA